MTMFPDLDWDKMIAEDAEIAASQAPKVPPVVILSNNGLGFWDEVPETSFLNREDYEYFVPAKNASKLHRRAQSAEGLLEKTVSELVSTRRDLHHYRAAYDRANSVIAKKDLNYRIDHAHLANRVEDADNVAFFSLILALAATGLGLVGWLL